MSMYRYLCTAKPDILFITVIVISLLQTIPNPTKQQVVSTINAFQVGFSKQGIVEAIIVGMLGSA